MSLTSIGDPISAGSVVRGAQIVASGGRKYTAGKIDRSKYDRMGWLTPFETNISDVEYQATEKGRAAAVANGR
jgi:hypothetical protein